MPEGPCRTHQIAVMSVRQSVSQSVSQSVCDRAPAFIYGPIFTNEVSNDSSNAADVPFGHYNHVRQLGKKLWAKNCLDTRNLGRGWEWRERGVYLQSLKSPWRNVHSENFMESKLLRMTSSISMPSFMKLIHEVSWINSFQDSKKKKNKICRTFIL